MVLKQVSVCIILLYLLCARVEAQIEDDLKKINQELDKLILKHEIGSPSTMDEKELKKELEALQTARNLPDGGNEGEQRKSFSAKSEAVKAFEYYLSRREDLKATINRLLTLAENLNDSLTANSLKNALNQGNSYKEFTIMNALERFAAVQINPQTPSETNPYTNLYTNRPNGLSNLLDILSQFIGSGGHLFSPSVYNQITWDPSKNNNNLNDQLRDLLNRLNKKLDSFKKQDYDDWSEWLEWFD